MAADFQMQAHDLLPSIQGTAKTGGVAVDLTNAVSAKFIMRPADSGFLPTSGGAITVNSAAVIVTPATSGVLRYDWVVGDTATPGNYVGQFQVTWPGTKPQTFPTTTYITITVLADLDGA